MFEVHFGVEVAADVYLLSLLDLVIPGTVDVGTEVDIEVLSLGLLHLMVPGAFRIESVVEVALLHSLNPEATVDAEDDLEEALQENVETAVEFHLLGLLHSNLLGVVEFVGRGFAYFPCRGHTTSSK